MKVRNWRTTVTGILAIVSAAWTMFNTGTIDAASISAIMAGIGLISAKDSNVTGGTKQV